MSRIGLYISPKEWNDDRYALILYTSGCAEFIYWTGWEHAGNNKFWRIDNWIEANGWIKI